MLLSHYSTLNPFRSVFILINNTNNGSIVRNIHIIRSSFIFILLFLHILKISAISASSGNNVALIIVGLIIWVLFLAAAFTGYILPWGQMSFWGVTVITNIFTAIPIVGVWVVLQLWGGPAVSVITLRRLFILHFILPLVIFVFAIIHILVLHSVGSYAGSPLNAISAQSRGLDYISLYPYFLIKDLFYILIFLTICLLVVFYFPRYVDNPVNSIKANKLITPKHVVPEWYFLYIYSVLKLISNKYIGLGLLIIVLFSPFIQMKSFIS